MPILIVVFVSLLSLVSSADCLIPELPSQFVLNQKSFSWSTTLDLETEEGDFGSVTEKMLSATTAFTYQDSNGEHIASAQEKFWSWGVQVDVFDCEDRLIGSIKEDVAKSFFKVHTTYTILDPAGVPVAVSNKVDVLATSFTLKDAEGAVVATIDRPAFNAWGDNWTVNIANPSVIDPRILVMIGAYKTSADDSSN